MGKKMPNVSLPCAHCAEPVELEPYVGCPWLAEKDHKESGISPSAELHSFFITKNYSHLLFSLAANCPIT